MSVSDVLARIKSLQKRSDTVSSSSSKLIILHINLAKLDKLPLLTRVIETLTTAAELSVMFRNLPVLAGNKSKNQASLKSTFMKLSKFESSSGASKKIKSSLVITVFDDVNLHYDVALECNSKLNTRLIGDRSVAKALYGECEQNHCEIYLMFLFILCLKI